MTTPGPRGSMSAPPRPSFGWRRASAIVVASVWAATASVLLARLLGGQFLLRRMRRGASTVGSASHRILAACRAELRLSRTVSLSVHPSIASPIALGGLRPIVLVPPDWEDWPEADRRACLLHELTHLARRDDWAKLAQELARIPLFFHPLVGWLVARLDRERELLCDEVVVALGADPLAYARLLLGLARRPGRLLPAAAGLRPGWLPFLDRRTVTARIERLLEADMPRTLTPPSALRRFAMGVLALAVALGVGGLTLRGNELMTEEKPPQRPPASEPVATPPRARTLSGVVRDADAHPLAGVTVVGGVDTLGRRPVVDTVGSRAEALTTDLDGRFTFQVPDGEHVIFSVSAHKDGFTGGGRGTSLGLVKDAEAFDLTLVKPEPFTATLLDPQGRAVAGATVRIESSVSVPMVPIPRDIEPTWASLARSPGAYVPWTLIAGTPLERMFQTKSDAQGRFEFGVLPPRAWVKLRVTVPGRGEMRIAPQDGVPGPKLLVEHGYVSSPTEAPASLTLMPTAKVAGRVTTRLPGVSVAGIDVGLQGMRGSALSDSAEARTDAEGRFEIDGLKEGGANVFPTQRRPDPPWTYRAVEDAPLRPGETTEVAIELIEGVQVAGRVVSIGTVAPIADAPVALYGPSRPQSGAAVLSTKTDRDGIYRFRLPPGETLFYLHGPVPGYTRLPHPESTRAIAIPEGVARFTVPPIEMQPTTRVGGRLVDGRGEPVVGARILGMGDHDAVAMAVDPGPDARPDPPLAVTEAQGRFRLADRSETVAPPNQATSFQVELRDGRRFKVAAVPSASGEVVLKIPALADASVKGLATVAPDELAGVVLDPGGRPLGGVLVEESYWVANHTVTTTDENGHFRLTKLRRGLNYGLRLRKEGYETQYYFRPTGESGWVVVLGNGTSFEGRVLAPDGAPVPDALVRAIGNEKTMSEGETVTEAKTGPDGRYHFYVVPGQYDISVRVAGVGVARLPMEAIAPDRRRTLDLRLAAGTELVARAVDSKTGQPVAGVRLWHRQRPGIDGTSGADGLIRIHDAPPGKYSELKVAAKGYSRWWSDACRSEWNRYRKGTSGEFQGNFRDLDFEIKPGTNEVTIQLERGVRVGGRVVDPDGRPVASATVALTVTGSGESPTTLFRTDGEGRFSALWPASGACECNLVAHDGKYGEWRTWANGVLPPMRTTPGQVIEGIEIRLTRPGTITGRVIGAQDQPVAGREVRTEAIARDEIHLFEPKTRTGPDGTFTLKLVRPGTHSIRVGPFWMEPGPSPKGTNRTVIVESGRTIEGVELRAAPGR
jgi:hypothetical protein